MLAVRTTYYNDIVCWISDGCKQKFLDLVNGWIGILIRDKEKRMQNDLLNPNLFGNEAGEDEVRPCDGLQTGRHDERQREHGKQHAQQRVVNAGQVGVDIAEGRDLGGHPAERHKDRHNTGDDTDELISVREVREHIGNGGEVVAAQPLGEHHNDDERQ